MRRIGAKLPSRGARCARQRGAALTEFAIVAPLFVAMIYGSLYLTELGVFRLKTQEVARYSAWAFTTRPLSNYEAREINSGAHREYFEDARDSIGEELEAVYADLDGANRGPTRVPGKTASAQYDFQRSDLRVENTQLIPDGGNQQLAEPFSAAWTLLSVLGVGTNVDSLVSGPFTRLGFNLRSQVTGQARVSVLTPVRRTDARAALAMAKHGGERGADLSQWNPSGDNIEEAKRPLATTLVVDPWRVNQGWSAHPGRYQSDQEWRRNRDKTHFSNVVSNIGSDGKAFSAIPGGSLVSLVLSVSRFLDYIPPGLIQFIGIPDQKPEKHVFSRPYTSATNRDPRPNPTRESPLAAGQVDIFFETGADPESSEAIRKFETMPMYLENENAADSGYYESLKERGNGFMGCPDLEKRGCWEQ